MDDLKAGQTQAPELRLFVLSDTHVGDRAKALDPELLQAIRENKPDLILHAGDVSKQAVLDILGEIAPVRAVQGNRDWLQRLELPKSLRFEINGIKIALAHGHINMVRYVLNYVQLFLTFHRKPFLCYQKQLANLFPDADLIIYGHTHYQVDEEFEGKRFINPGAAYAHRLNRFKIQYCTLTISQAGEVQVHKFSISKKARR